MVRLLILVRYFPPSGGSGVQRLARLARYLPAQGIETDVVTTDLVAEGAGLDPDLASEIPDGVHVERIPVRASRRLQSAVASLHLGFAYYRGLRLFGVPDPATVDVPEMARGALTRTRPDIVLASSPPFSSLIAGRIAASRFGVPWIADMRDPWSHHPWFRAITPLHLRAMHALEAITLATAAKVIVVSEEMRDLVPRSACNRTVVIENGFDPKDLENFKPCPGPTPDEKPFRLVFVGTLQRSIHLGVLSDLPPGFELEVVGRTLVPPPASAVVHGYVPHRDALRAMSQADALVLALPPELSFAPTSKIYEYLVAGPPVLAIVPPDGAAARLIRSVRGGMVVTPGDRAALNYALEELRQGHVDVAPVEERRERLRSNRRDVQAEVLARLIREVVGHRTI